MARSGVYLLFFVLLLVGCDIGSQAEDNLHVPTHLSRQEALKFKQYATAGKAIYLSKCANCHQADGQGLAKLYPPIAKADFFINNQSKSICMIKNGYSEPLVINGVEYTMTMPAFEKLTPLEIAEVMTYMGNSWGNRVGYVTAEQVRAYLRTCEQ